MREGARCLLVHYLRETVAVHRIDVIVFLERKLLEVAIPLCEADAIGRLARRDDNLADAELFYSSLCGVSRQAKQSKTSNDDRQAGERSEDLTESLFRIVHPLKVLVEKRILERVFG